MVYAHENTGMNILFLELILYLIECQKIWFNLELMNIKKLLENFNLISVRLLCK